MILKLLNKGSNVFYFLTHKAYLILVHLPISFFWHWPKIEEKGEENGGILECLGSPFDLFPKLYFSWFHRGLKLVAWDYEEKPVVAELSFSFAIPKATPIKCMLSSDEASEITWALPRHHRVSSVWAKRCASRASRFPRAIVFSSEKCGRTLTLQGFRCM